ncbi:hypothetical protein QO002_005745 [Pararhizobium capsulatum DSM 1112]|uniref:Uncharacterized protein n=1 Tax=Pararhizobium capsulatum DSM 1112 TaxID=1121113 RepID=A0ABU0BZ71_9HYPH|nr:hypothetical protein [Pararhizobium capsulatum DSM 1112]
MRSKTIVSQGQSPARPCTLAPKQAVSQKNRGDEALHSCGIPSPFSFRKRSGGNVPAMMNRVVISFGFDRLFFVCRLSCTSRRNASVFAGYVSLLRQRLRFNIPA